MMAKKSKSTFEICIRVDRATLGVEVAEAAVRLAHVLRRRYGATVLSTAVVYPPVSDTVVISSGGFSRSLD